MPAQYGILSKINIVGEYNVHEIFLGDVIKRRRLELGMTQEQLCEGICEPITISRLENGKQTPSRSRINALLQRLGLPGERYYALVSKNEEEEARLRREINDDIVQFYQKMGEGKVQVWEQATRALDELEGITDSDDTLARQFILRNRALLGERSGAYPYEKQLEMLLEAMRLTAPRFDPEEVGQLRYTWDEIQLINQIAMVYALTGQRKTAIGLYSQLLKYLQKYMESKKYLCLVTFNYARELVVAKRYEDAIEVAEIGRKTCIDRGHYQFLPGLLAIEAECAYFLGDRACSKELYCQARYIYKAIGDEHNLKKLEIDAREQLGTDFTF